METQYVIRKALGYYDIIDAIFLGALQVQVYQVHCTGRMLGSGDLALGCLRC